MYIDPVIYRGRPAEKRSPKEEASYDMLDRLGIEYERMDHSPTDTMEVCEEIDRLMNMRACKNLFLCNKQKSRYFLVVIRGNKRFVTKNLSLQLGLPRLSFGHADAMEALLGVSPGSVSILGLANDIDNKVTLIVDRDVAEQEYFGCHPCLNTSSLKIKTSDIFEKFIPFTGHETIFFDC